MYAELVLENTAIKDVLNRKWASAAGCTRCCPEERTVICEFGLGFPKIGYRKLTWMMVDAGVVYVGESTVYRVLSEADLLSCWKRSAASSGEYHFRPTGPNQQWHTDVMYV